MMPSSPMLGRRSGTNSPKMDRLDFVKDSVIGELSSRTGKPIPDFNKNKRGKKSIFFKHCEFKESKNVLGVLKCIIDG